MTEMGYECCYQTENVSQYVSPLKVFGEVDFLHAFREITVEMLKKAEDREIFDGAITTKVLKIEDLIGLKVQAIANDESRKAKDLADIEALLICTVKK
jgi:predicted nucleotidyltransferase